MLENYRELYIRTFISFPFSSRVAVMLFLVFFSSRLAMDFPGATMSSTNGFKSCSNHLLRLSNRAANRNLTAVGKSVAKYFSTYFPSLSVSTSANLLIKDMSKLLLRACAVESKPYRLYSPALRCNSPTPTSWSLSFSPLLNGPPWPRSS